MFSLFLGERFCSLTVPSFVSCYVVVIIFSVSLISYNSLQVVAEKEIRANDPLLLNYGCLSNDLFLLDYGFVIPSNQYDTIELKYDGALLDAASLAAGVSSPNFSSPAPWQQEILSQLNLDGEAPDLKVLFFLILVLCFGRVVQISHYFRIYSRICLYFVHQDTRV